MLKTLFVSQSTNKHDEDDDYDKTAKVKKVNICSALYE